MKPEHIKKYCILDTQAAELLNEAYNRMKLSIRSYDRILRVSRRLAYLEGSSRIDIRHIAEAISYICVKEIFR